MNFESFFKSSRKNHKTLSRKKRPRVASTAGDECIRVINCSFQITASLSSSTVGNCCKETAPSEKKRIACGMKYKSRQVKIIYKAPFTDKVTKCPIPREKNKCNKTRTMQGQTQNYFNGCLNREVFSCFLKAASESIKRREEGNSKETAIPAEAEPNTAAIFSRSGRFPPPRI